MDTITAAAIQKAYVLIKAGKLDEAQAILIPLVRTDPNNAEAWYMLGFALPDSDKRLYAFQQVTRIDPSSQLARDQIAKLLASKPPASPFAPSPGVANPPTSPFTVMPDLTNTPPAPAAQPAWARTPVPYPVAAKEPAATDQKQAKKKRISPVVIGGVVVLVVCIIAVVFSVMSSKNMVVQLFPFWAPKPTARPKATLTIGPTPLPTTYTPAYRTIACPFTIPLGTRVRCGVVRVQQDRQNNSTALIELPVVIYQSPKPEADVVMFLQGGPGVESIDWSLSLFQDYVAPILAEHDMVFFDPRGTGRSKPALDCPELNSIFIDAYYQNLPQDEAFVNFLDSWGRCNERFIAKGVDPAAFNTTESAADVRDIVTALGYKQVNLLGISYGTRLGLAVMRDYPEIVRSAVLDSVVPMQGKMFNRRGSDTQYALDKLFAGCAGQTRCNAAYPDLAYNFNALVKKFSKTPATIKAYDPSTGFVSNVKANGVDMISAVVAGMHNSELVPVIPKAIYDIQHGDYTFLSFALGARGGTYNTTGLGTYFSTVCPEQVYVSTAQELDDDLNVSPPIKEYALTGLFGSSQNLFDLCAAWGAKTNDPQKDLPVTARIPTLIISGEYDPTTPSTTGEMIAKDLPDNQFFVIPGMGHGATIGNACSASIMMAFLREPEVALDSSCLTKKPFEFFLPYSGEQPVELAAMTDSTNGLQGLVPVGWKKKLPDAPYFRRAYLFDVTQVQVTAFSASKTIVLSQLAKSFQKSGFQGTPQKIDTHLANRLSWTIYTTKFNGEPVTVALGQVNTSRTLVLIMVTSAAERDAFYKGLFMPMLNALTPMW